MNVLKLVRDHDLSLKFKERASSVEQELAELFIRVAAFSFGNVACDGDGGPSHLL